MNINEMHLHLLVCICIYCEFLDVWALGINSEADLT